jgi:hypothetical protein
VAQVRSYVPRVEEDRSLGGELAALASALRSGELTMTGADRSGAPR